MQNSIALDDQLDQVCSQFCNHIVACLDSEIQAIRIELRYQNLRRPLFRSFLEWKGTIWITGDAYKQDINQALSSLPLIYVRPVSTHLQPGTQFTHFVLCDQQHAQLYKAAEQEVILNSLAGEPTTILHRFKYKNEHYVAELA